MLPDNSPEKQPSDGYEHQHSGNRLRYGYKTLYQNRMAASVIRSVLRVPCPCFSGNPAERADVIVDFTNVPTGTNIILQNLAPDYPYAGGTPGVDFSPADPNTTGQVMQLRVIARVGTDKITAPDQLVLAKPMPLPAAVKIRQASPRGLAGTIYPPEAWETALIALPGEITRVRAKFDLAGLFGIATF